MDQTLIISFENQLIFYECRSNLLWHSTLHPTGCKDGFEMLSFDLTIKSLCYQKTGRRKNYQRPKEGKECWR